MADDSLLPGWRCVAEEGDPHLVVDLLSNHGIEAEIVPVAAVGYKYARPTVLVRDADFDRAAGLVEQMVHAMNHPPVAFPWCCPSCMEENEAQFDICWNCGREKT